MKSPSDRHVRPSPWEIPAAAAERAATRYVEDEVGCYVSTYSDNGTGYAQIGWSVPPHEDGRRRTTMVTAHRAAWTHEHGPIPEGMTIDHRCKNRRCVRVSHLRMLTNHENARRTSGRDWPLGECANGHPNSELYLADGGRKFRCRPCYRETQRRYRARKRADVTA